jgi:Flp pilus assembly protein TadD
VEVAPQNSEQYYFLGLSHLEMKDHVQAEQDFRRAMQLNPRRPGIYMALATSLEKQGKVVEAKEALRAEIQLTGSREAALRLSALEKQ